VTVVSSVRQKGAAQLVHGMVLDVEVEARLRSFLYLDREATAAERRRVWLEPSEPTKPRRRPGFVTSSKFESISDVVEAHEIIVIDDASTDDSVSVIRKIAASNPSIRLLVNSQNLGVIPTERLGVECATGRYIYLAAADDRNPR